MPKQPKEKNKSKITKSSKTKKSGTKISKKVSKKSAAGIPKKHSKNSLPKISKEKKKLKLSNADRDKQLLQTIIEGMQEKKASNITVLDLQNIENSFCNYFVICEAESKTQLQAIADSVEEFTKKKLNTNPHHTEGLQNAEWILLDYLTIIAHVFRSDIRNFYNLENLWADAKIQHI